MGKSEETSGAFSNQQSTVGAGLVPARMRIASMQKSTETPKQSAEIRRNAQAKTLAPTGSVL